MTDKLVFRFIPFFILTIVFACESEKRIPPRGYIPTTSEPKEMLEASYFWIPQDQLKSSYWNEAPYVELSLTNGSVENLYPDGYLNMTGTYNGTSGFNQGNDPKATIKAGYDEEFLYLLIEWKDTTADASLASKRFAGPEDPLKSDSAAGWTSQGNNDNLSILFELQGGGFDVWKWNLAYTAPLNMAENLSADNSGTINNVSEIINDNSSDGSSRGRPLYEWNGERQEITLNDGTRRLLDPAYYLLDNMKTNYIGNLENGQKVFNETADCRFCHGPDGNGVSDGSTNGGTLSNVFTNRYSREGLIEFIGSGGHEGRGPQYWGRIKNDSAAVVDLIAFLRGIAGVPGNTINPPSTEPDIKALTNIGTGTVNTTNSNYQVLLRRKLQNGITDDIQFSSGNSYYVTVRLTDNDDINYVESQPFMLLFKSNEL